MLKIIIGVPQPTQKVSYGFNPTTGQQGLWSTDPIWQANIAEHQLTSEQTQYHYLHTDHLYTPMLATDATGEISWKAVQEAFGAVNALQHQSRTNMNLRFPGQYYDQETGTHYNFQRDYKPNAGRYVQSDPIGLRGGVNIYSYAKGNPFFYLDDLGLFCIPLPSSSSGWKNVGEIVFYRYILWSHSGFGHVWCQYKKMGKQEQERIVKERLLCYECLPEGCSGEEKCTFRVWDGKESTETRVVEVVMDRKNVYGYVAANITGNKVVCKNPWDGKLDVDPETQMP